MACCKVFGLSLGAFMVPPIAQNQCRVSVQSQFALAVESARESQASWLRLLGLSYTAETGFQRLPPQQQQRSLQELQALLAGLRCPSAESESSRPAKPSAA